MKTNFGERATNEKLMLEKDESLEDVQTMSRIILEARGVSQAAASESDRMFPLTLLCVFAHPLKTPEYTREAAKFRMLFKGISHDEFKQRMFRESLGGRVISAKTLEDIPFAKFNECFTVPETASS